MKLKSTEAAALPAFLPLPQLQIIRKAGRTELRTGKLERYGGDFSFSAGQQNVTFRYGVDFVEGNDRLRWTPAGIDKLLAASSMCAGISKVNR